MEQDELVEMAREAYTLSRQIESLENSMADDEHMYGYRADAENFNVILRRAREILELDPLLLRSIEHIPEYDPNKRRGYGVDFGAIKTQLGILKSTLHAFVQFNCPPEEKEKFGQEELR